MPMQDDHELRLQGIVSGHPKLPDGKILTTSPILQLNVEEKICITENYTYTLGNPNEVFLKFLEENQIELSKFNTGSPIIN